MYKEHPVFEPPPPEAVLWRYLDFTKFVSLLDNQSLFFARADKLGDPFEGSISKADVEAQTELIKQNISSQLAGSFGRRARRNKNIPRFMLVNCWHESNHESEAMWKLYAREGDGIVVKTHFGSLAESFVGEEDIFISRVKYIDYTADLIPSDNIFYPYLHKRESFRHEQEVRAITINFPVVDSKIDWSQNSYNVGRNYSVDISTLIEEVIVAPSAPDWFLQLVESVAKRYNLAAPITKSSLADPPTWGIGS